jgi:hypothetical protein
MPRILVTSLPKAVEGTAGLQDLLINGIPLAVEGTAGFDISRRHVYAYALADLVVARPARVVIFTVEGRLDRPERTGSMRRALCDAICETLAAFLARTDISYEAILGWCVRIDRDEDGFVRRAPDSVRP